MTSATHLSGRAHSRALVVVLMLVVALLAAGCGDSSGGSGGGAGDGTTTPAAAKPVPGGKVVYGISAETDGWSPANNRWVPGGLNVARAVYDPLAAFDENGDPRPYLAESIEPNDDYTVWTITLRDGITFHNGEALTGDIVAQNLEAVRTSGLIGPSMKLAESVEATGPLEVTVTMSQPWATFPVLIAQQPGFVAYPTTLTGEAEEPIGTGPFQYDEWIRDDHFTAIRNEHYWRTDADGVQLPYLNEVEFRVITQSLSRQQALEAGDVDMMHTSGAQQLMDYGQDLDPGDGFNITYTAGADDEQLIALNSQTGAGDDPRLRHALALATDREGLNNELYEGYFTVADAPYQPGSRWYTDPEWPDYDPDAAREIIDGLKADEVNTHITLSVVTDTEYVTLAQAIAEMWESVGIDVDIESQDAGTLTLNIVTGKYEAALFSLFNAPDPDGDYHFWDPSNITEPGQFSLAFTRFQNDSLKEAMDTARATLDEATRAAEYGKVWHIVATQFPILWLWHTQYVVVSRDSVHGIDGITLPDGSPAQVVNWGSVFLTQVWTA